MTTVTASQVQELRHRTGVGMMDCKKALEESGGDLEQAIDLLADALESSLDLDAPFLDSILR